MYIVFSNGNFIDVTNGGIYNSDNNRIDGLDPRELKMLNLLIKNVNAYTSMEKLKVVFDLSPEKAHRNIVKRVSSLRNKIVVHSGYLPYEIIRTIRTPKVKGYGLFLNSEVILSKNPPFTKTDDTFYESPERGIERKRINALADEASSDSKIGRNRDALDKRLEVYRWREEHLGKEHEETVRAMANLATSYSKLKMHENALDLRRKVLDIRKKVCEPSDDRLRMAKKNLAVSLNQIGGPKNLSEAEQLRKEISEMFDSDG